jgi:hypothetical protein
MRRRRIIWNRHQQRGDRFGADTNGFNRVVRRRFGMSFRRFVTDTSDQNGYRRTRQQFRDGCHVHCGIHKATYTSFLISQPKFDKTYAQAAVECHRSLPPGHQPACHLAKPARENSGVTRGKFKKPWQPRRRGSNKKSEPPHFAREKCSRVAEAGAT